MLKNIDKNIIPQLKKLEKHKMYKLRSCKSPVREMFKIKSYAVEANES